MRELKDGYVIGSAKDFVEKASFNHVRNCIEKAMMIDRVVIWDTLDPNGFLLTMSNEPEAIEEFEEWFEAVVFDDGPSHAGNGGTG